MNNDLHRSRHGATLVVFGICIVALLGISALVVDIGRLYVAKQRAQNVSDAAAIAGGWELKGTVASETNATTEAQSIINDNNTKMSKWSVGDTSISFPTSITKADGTTITVTAGNAIRVEGKVNVNFAFATIFKLFGNTNSNSSKAGATAIVVREPANSLSGKLVPWAMVDDNVWGAPGYTPGISVQLIITDPTTSTLGPGNFGAIYYSDVDSKNKHDYEDRVEGNGGLVDLTLLSTVSNREGNIKNFTVSGLNTRFKNYTMLTFDQWKSQGMPDCPQVVLLPIVEDPNDSHQQTFQVKGFAAYFIESYGIVNKQPVVNGYFISGVESGGVINWDWSIPSSGTTLIYDLHLVK